MNTHALVRSALVALAAAAATLAPTAVAVAAGSGYGSDTGSAPSGSVSFPTVVTSRSLGTAGGQLQGTTSIGTVTVQVAPGQLTGPEQVTVAEALPGGVSVPAAAGNCARVLDALQVSVAAVDGTDGRQLGASGAGAPVLQTTLDSSVLAGTGVSVIVRDGDGQRSLTAQRQTLRAGVRTPGQLMVVRTGNCAPGTGSDTGTGTTDVTGTGRQGTGVAVGSLPRTGLPVGAWASLAVALLSLGSLALVVSRRKRS